MRTDVCSNLATPARQNCMQQSAFKSEHFFCLHTKAPNGILMFITVFTTARYIKPCPALPSCSRHTLISKSHLTLWPSKWSLALNFPTKILHVFSSIRVTFPSHPPQVHHPTNIWWGVKITKLLIFSILLLLPSS